MTRLVVLLLPVVAIGLVTTVGPAQASCIPGFDYGVFTTGGQSFENHAQTDSYNSGVAGYAAGGCSGNLGTNASIAMQNNVTVCGTATTAPGGSVSTSNSASYTTPAQTLPSAVTLPPVSVPTLAANGNATYSDNKTHAITPNKSYTSLGCSGPHTVLTLSAGSYVVGNVTMSQCDLQVTSGPVVVYFTGTMDLSTNATVNVPSTSGVPTNLLFEGTGTNTIHIYTGVTFYGGIYAPNASEVHIEQHTDIYGAIVAGGFHGENYSSIHYDQAMANLGVGGFACPAGEVSRGSPVVATISGSTAIVQGTFVPPSGTRKTIAAIADVATFAFPYITGHMRARTTASISATGSSYASGTILFDAAASGKIPARSYASCTTFSGSCRHVFTNTNATPSNGLTFHPTRVDLNDSNSGTIGALIAPIASVTGMTAGNAAGYWQTIVRTVMDASLGGVDRSTVAVIGASTFAGNVARPTIAYVGATDGMIHAVCASTGGVTATGSNLCPSLGTELWAFVPRMQLPLIRSNTARLDGSVTVIDAFGDVTNTLANGTKSWHTIMTFQTGYSIGSSPATYAIDVTDPANPTILWEYTTPTSPSSQDFGTGLVVALGSTHVNATLTNLAVAETNNGGSSGAAVVATALQLETGAKQWRFAYAFPSTPRGGAGNLPYPTTGIPGGAVGVDLIGSGEVSDFVFGDLYGDVWRVGASTGTSFTGASTALFSFTTDKHPLGTLPAIYSSSGNQYAAFASGGYDDPTAASWSTSSQYVIAVRLKPTGATFPIKESDSTCSTCNLMLSQALTNTKGFAQALVVGTQLFVTSDSSDVNASTYGSSAADTGTLTTFNLATSAATTVVVHSGAGSLVNVGTTLYTSSSDKQQQLASSATSSTGSSIDVTAKPKLQRTLWLRTQ